VDYTARMAGKPLIAEAITPEAKKIIYLYYYDQIDPGRVKTIMAIINGIIMEEKPDTIYFLFSSNGGAISSGVTLYNFLKSLPVDLIMHNIGAINSIANVIFLAGKERYASPHTTFLFHGAAVHLNAMFSLPQINEIQDSLQKDHNTIAGIICDNTKISHEEINKLFAQGETKDAEFALKAGIVHKIKPAEVPQQARFISINING
jgi:ATP-dependent protease ClpP protease subunit